MNNLTVKTTPVFWANKAAMDEGWPIICNEGGSRSSKSYSIVQLLISVALQKPKTRISFVSHSLPHIKRGVYRDFQIIMEDLQQWSDDCFSYTDFVYTFPNGSYIELFGLEDEGKARGPGRDILFINEANLIKKPLFDQLAMRTTGTIFLDWNPADFTSWVYGIADDPRNKCIHSTYLNNLSNLSQTQVEYIETYKNLPDDFLWKVYGLGQRGAAKELIYTQWKYDQQPTNGDVFFGLDFGFNHPAVLTKVVHYDGCNYVHECFYKSNMTPGELIAAIKEHVKGREVIYADAAEPKSIEDIYRAGMNIKPANKDVWNGIITVKQYPLFITPQSQNIVKELGSYKWKKDKNDNVLEEPVKANDDAMDSMRYAIHTHLSKPKFVVSVF